MQILGREKWKKLSKKAQKGAPIKKIATPKDGVKNCKEEKLLPNGNEILRFVIELNSTTVIHIYR